MKTIRFLLLLLVAQVAFAAPPTLPPFQSSNITLNQYLDLTEIASPANPASGVMRLYSKSGDGVFYRNNAGTESQLSTTSNATPTVAGIVTSYFGIIQSAINAVSSANYTITTTDGYEAILVSTGASTRTITLPAASSNKGRVIWIKKTDSGAGTVSVARAGSDTIDGATSYTLTSQYDAVALVSDGTATWGNITRFISATTGSGSAVFATSPSIATPTLTGTVTASGLIDVSTGTGIKLPTPGGTAATLNDYEENSATSCTFTWNGTGGNTGSVTLRWVHSGAMVSLFVPAITATTGTSSTTLSTSASCIPSRISPANAIDFATQVRDNATNQQGVVGRFTINTDGSLVFTKVGGAAFTNAANAGINGNSTFTYPTL